MKASKTKKLKKHVLSQTRIGESISKYLKPTTDIAFKKLFGTQERANITRDFLNAVLEREPGERIKTITIADSANLPEAIDKKKSFVDINCTDQEGHKYIIEMQVINEYDFAERAQYYASAALTRQLKIKDSYRKLVPVIFVGILGFNLDQEESEALNHHALVNLRSGKRLLHHLQFHFVELSKFEKTTDQLKTTCDKWIYFMKNAGSINSIPEQLRSDELTEAFHVLESTQWSDAELDAYSEQAYAAGGRQRIREGAQEEGREELRLEIAREMLTDGDSINKIARITKLDVTRIKQLKNARVK